MGWRWHGENWEVSIASALRKRLNQNTQQREIIGKGPSGRAGGHPCPQIAFDVGTAAACALVGTLWAPPPSRARVHPAGKRTDWAGAAPLLPPG